MINVLSQKINKDNIETIYDCSITIDDLICFTHSNIYDNTNQDVVSNLRIDFPTLRDFVQCGLGQYESGKFKFIETECCYRIYTIGNEEYISIPKTFLFDSYQILKKIWVDD